MCIVFFAKIIVDFHLVLSKYRTDNISQVQQNFSFVQFWINFEFSIVFHFDFHNRFWKITKKIHFFKKKFREWNSYNFMSVKLTWESGTTNPRSCQYCSVNYGGSWKRENSGWKISRKDANSTWGHIKLYLHFFEPVEFLWVGCVQTKIKLLAPEKMKYEKMISRKNKQTYLAALDYFSW